MGAWLPGFQILLGSVVREVRSPPPGVPLPDFLLTQEPPEGPLPQLLNAHPPPHGPSIQ